ncbi:MAG: hypothetical protein NTW60_00630 [Candidatus Wolfebacteria bacterium]|nr:hypothetical protein [Candidatus Wolfebacteria bacterium]
MYKNFILPASLLAATIIGAGIFSLPYVFVKAGLVTGLFYLILFTAVLILIHLMYADVILRTESKHLFTGYAELYLGKAGKWLAAMTTILGMILIMTAYLVLSANFINLMLPSLDIAYRILLFWVLSSIPIFWGVKRLAASEFLTTIGVIFIISLIFFYGAGSFVKVAATPLFNMTYLFLPYGAVLFSLSGRTAIPALIHYFDKNHEPERRAKKAIIWGTLLPAFLYLIFVIGIINLPGTISEDTVSGLMGNLPQWFLLLVGALGLISLWDTYAMVGRDIRKSLEADFGFNDNFAGTLVAVSPLILYFAGLKNFMDLVGLVGGVFIGLESLFIVLIWQKAKKLNPRDGLLRKIPAFIPYLLLIIFIIGILLEIK